MNADVIALREHLVEEVEQRRHEVMSWQRLAREWHTGCAAVADRHVTIWQRNAATAHSHARTATDAWLAADARLRALDGLLAASKVQADERPWHHRSWPPTGASENAHPVLSGVAVRP